MDDITESPIKLDYLEESASKAGLLSIIDLNAGQCDLSVPRAIATGLFSGQLERDMN